MTETDEAIDRGYDAALLRRLLVYIRPYRGLTLIAVLLLLAGAGLALVGRYDVTGAVAADDAARVVYVARRAES